MPPNPIQPLDDGEVVCDRILAVIASALVGVIFAAQLLRGVLA